VCGWAEGAEGLCIECEVLRVESGVSALPNNSIWEEKMKNKFEEAIGLFWGASLFFGALVAFIAYSLIAIHLWQAVTIGVLSFLFVGLIAQGILTLIKKD